MISACFADTFFFLALLDLNTPDNRIIALQRQMQDYNYYFRVPKNTPTHDRIPMSRSIHETRNTEQTTRREDWRDPDAHENRLAQIADKLKQKRAIKTQIASERAIHRALHPHERVATSTDLLAIPIRVVDEGPFIHYPATPDDLRGIMQRLPRSVCDGLAEIQLGLGADEPPADWAATLDHVPDPYTGRVSGKMLPEVWAMGTLGIYFDETATIRLHAFVYPPDLKDREIKEFLLKLRALSTFVHEVAHHYDHSSRSARGRWLAEEGDKSEKYADEMRHTWLHEVVVPYLEQTHPVETRNFIDWVEHHGGVLLTLDQMAGDPRKIIFNIMETLFFLITNVEEGMDEIETRYEFADEIHMCGFYDEARSIIENLLTQYPDDLALLRLKAHILIDQDHCAEGRELILRILEADPTYEDAWSDLAHACEGLKLWNEVIAAVAHQIELQASDTIFRAGLVRPRIRARIALGDFAGAEADIQILEQSSSKRLQKAAAEYRETLRRLPH